MYGSTKPLDNPMNWSFGVGRIFGIRIRLHVLFVLGAVIMLTRSLREQHELGGSGVGEGFITIALLFLIVLLHEFGHCFGARWVGGTADEILLWPLGGLAYTHPPHNPRAHLITTAAGPAVNVVLCLLAAAVLVASTGSISAVPWNPFVFAIPSGWRLIDWDSWQRWVLLCFSLSYTLLLFNLMPVYPFDGGRMLQELLWPRLGYRRSTMLASGIGMVGAIVIAVVGFVSDATMLFFIAAFGYMTCWLQRQQLRMTDGMDADGFGYDFSQGYSSLERSGPSRRKPGYWERRRIKRAIERRERRLRDDEVRQSRLDAILAKVRSGGLGSLSPQERRFLEQETQRRQASERP